eukprot:gb/GECG01005558.1/.p1 GENE.gb/GECG01005558.1/~~gb/GECG01005558.1/.p1  ORF type:complete len:114 (+),score=11.93 gb/GECG01005558.1/:1-342(+)
MMSLKKSGGGQGDPRDASNVWGWKAQTDDASAEFGMADVWQLCSMGTGVVSLLWKNLFVAWFALLFTIAAFTTQSFAKRDLRTLTMSFAFSISTLFMLHFRQPGMESNSSAAI